MKKSVLVILGLIFSITVFSQLDSTQPIYKRFPFFPPVKLLLADSSTFTKEILPKKQPVLLMVFSPTCEHCQHETEELVKNIDKFKKITIVMATMMPYDSMMNFRSKYGLAQYDNIIIGQDTKFFLPPYFDIHNLPFLAFYNKKGNFVSIFEGNLPMNKVLAELEK